MATPTASYSSSQSTTSHSPYDLLPPTTNRWIETVGELTLYNQDLLLAAQALLQHTAVFGILFLLRGFSPKRALDLHYLTIIFALSFVVAPLVFLLDARIDALKLLFFLEHEAVEFLIAIRVLAPAKLVSEQSGLIVLLCWLGLTVLTIVVVLDSHVKHAADVVAWSAFFSDFAISIAGVWLVKQWLVTRWEGKFLHNAGIASREYRSSFARRKLLAEALAGVGFILHGVVTMAVGPIFTLVLYNNLNPAYFAYAWVAVFLAAFITVALSIPVAGIFFSTIWWCFGHRKRVLPGQVQREEGDVTDMAQPGLHSWPTERGHAGSTSVDLLPRQQSPYRDLPWASRGTHRRTNSNVQHIPVSHARLPQTPLPRTPLTPRHPLHTADYARAEWTNRSVQQLPPPSEASFEPEEVALGYRAARSSPSPEVSYPPPGHNMSPFSAI